MRCATHNLQRYFKCDNYRGHIKGSINKARNLSKEIRKSMYIEPLKNKELNRSIDIVTRWTSTHNKLNDLIKYQWFCNVSGKHNQKLNPVVAIAFNFLFYFFE